MNAGMEFAHKFARAYAAACKPLCRELKLPQTAFDILMFLANNPGYRTAGDIVEVRRIKANLVSVNVDKLVREGYLRRETVERPCSSAPSGRSRSLSGAARCNPLFLSSSLLIQTKKCARASSGRSPLWTPILTPC